MKVVVVGTNQANRKKVAEVIKDKYGGLAEENATLLKKLERSNDAWIRGREESADLEKAVKVFQDDTVARKAHIEHLEGQGTALTEENERLREALEYFASLPTQDSPGGKPFTDFIFAIRKYANKALRGGGE